MSRPQNIFYVFGALIRRCEYLKYADIQNTLKSFNEPHRIQSRSGGQFPKHPRKQFVPKITLDRSIRPFDCDDDDDAGDSNDTIWKGIIRLNIAKSYAECVREEKSV